MFSRIISPVDGFQLAEAVLPYVRGRSGLGRAIMGSVADRVVCRTGAPVLLVRT